MQIDNDDNTPFNTETLIGCVKWFNNKAGYGFITTTDTTSPVTDIFVHHSSINVDNPQYKYLIQGEYIQFNLLKTTSSNHEWQAININGINGGKLMCETRRDFKLARFAYKKPMDENTLDNTTLDNTTLDENIQTELIDNTDNKDWTLIQKKNQINQIKQTKFKPLNKTSLPYKKQQS
jgi:cold shock CspA family protein